MMAPDLPPPRFLLDFMSIVSSFETQIKEL